MPAKRRIGLRAVRGAVVVAVAFSSLVGTSARADTVIDTGRGPSGICGLGATSTTAIGQTVTAPTRDTQLDRFTFYIQPAVVDQMTLRGELYEWNGSSAAGPALWESGPRTISSSSPSDVVFTTGGVQLRPGLQYVLFVTSLNDEAVGLSCWLAGSRAYDGGTLVLRGEGPGDWTSGGWFVYPVLDMGFEAVFSAPMPNSKDDCKHGGWRRYDGAFKNQGQCVSFVVRRR